MYKADAPHGVASSSAPVLTTRTSQLKTKLTVIPVLKNGSEKMQLLNEALARARMRDLWRGEHRHKRSAAQILRDVKRYRSIR